MTTDAGAPVRAGSAEKRAKILDAARELLLRDGFDRTSMDAVAGLAAVSKRTIYDYYGDKTRLVRGVVELAATSLLESLQSALDAHLADDAPIGTLDDLERALTAFAIELGTTVVGSADYATVVALAGRVDTAEGAGGGVLQRVPEDEIAERLAAFAARGLLDLDDARQATEHFTALTILLAYSNQNDPRHADPDDVRAIMTAGVHAFVRAYGAR